jgi:hypothetical protein
LHCRIEDTRAKPGLTTGVCRCAVSVWMKAVVTDVQLILEPIP